MKPALVRIIVGVMLLSLSSCGGGGASSSTSSTAKLLSMSFSPSDPTIMVGYTVQFTVTAHYSDGTMANISSTVAWTSSPTAVAGVSTTGLASCVGLGQADVSASPGGGTTLTCVEGNISNIQITPATMTITAGSPQQYTAVGTVDGKQVNLNGPGELDWAIDNSAGNLISIDNTGLLSTDSSISSQQIVHITASDPVSGAVSNTATLTVNP